MTAEMTIIIASREHTTKEPVGYPFALFCTPVIDGQSLVECASRNRMGFLGEFKTARAVRQAGLAHEHAVLIRDFRNPRKV